MKKNIIFLATFCVTVYADEKVKLPWYKRLIPGLGSEKVTLSTMNYDQLCIAKDKALTNKDHTGAIRYLERMAKICPDQAALSAIVLELASLLFEDGKFSKAILLYDQYLKSYPGRTTEYVFAHYRKILCSFYQTLEIDRDQTMTEKTIELCDSFLNTCKNSDYEKDVRSMRIDCTQKLAHHELYIADNYIIQNRFVSANRRIARIRDTYPTVPGIEPRRLLSEIHLAEKVGNTQFAQARRQELVEKFPEHQSVIVAQTKKPKSMASRF